MPGYGGDMAETLALPDLLRHAGAVMTQRGGRAVPAHFGSAAGELSVCVRGVGLALRSDLGTVSVTGSARSLDQLLSRSLGHGIAVGGAALEAGAWWCRPREDEILLICREDRGQRLVASLGREVARFTSATLSKHGEDQIVLEIVGGRTDRLLADLGVVGDPRDASPVVEAPVAGCPATWVLQSDRGALAVVAATDAPAAWQCIDDLGRPHGISCIGIESLERYMLLERAAGRPTLL